MFVNCVAFGIVILIEFYILHLRPVRINIGGAWKYIGTLPVVPTKDASRRLTQVVIGQIYDEPLRGLRYLQPRVNLC